MIPLTVRDLLKASNGADDVCEIDGVPVDQAIVIGRVFKLEEQSTRAVFHIDDTTGSIQIAHYKRQDNPTAINIDFKDNMYVKCVVVVRPFKNQKMYVSNVIQPVTDYNQVTYHFLNCFLAHAQRVKGALPKPDPTNNMQGGGNQQQQ
mmetsp:Transcript_21329/g.18469  ORF Transcript_21329/g.18469 Transcript_21329/m.18469 type:complete len:148 (-) Transcript_21329:1999-2442(-)